MSRPTPQVYKTKNWPADNDALKRRDSLTIWFDPEMVWTPPPTGKRGHQPDFSDAAIQTCLTIKVLFGMALRQATGFVESLLRLVGLDWAVPNYSTLCRRQKTLVVNVPYRGSQGPLHLLIDSTGIKAEGEGEWHARKHGGPKRRLWRKLQLGMAAGRGLPDRRRSWARGLARSPPQTGASTPRAMPLKRGGLCRISALRCRPGQTENRTCSRLAGLRRSGAAGDGRNRHAQARPPASASRASLPACRVLHNDSAAARPHLST